MYETILCAEKNLIIHFAEQKENYHCRNIKLTYLIILF